MLFPPSVPSLRTNNTRVSTKRARAHTAPGCPICSPSQWNGDCVTVAAGRPAVQAEVDEWTRKENVEADQHAAEAAHHQHHQHATKEQPWYGLPLPLDVKGLQVGWLGGRLAASMVAVHGPQCRVLCTRPCVAPPPPCTTWGCRCAVHAGRGKVGGGGMRQLLVASGGERCARAPYVRWGGGLVGQGVCHGGLSCARAGAGAKAKWDTSWAMSPKGFDMMVT